MHGTFHNIPAKIVCAKCDEQGIEVQAIIRDTALFGKNLVMKRRIFSAIESEIVTLEDTLVNEGYKDEEYCLLYHINVGYRIAAKIHPLTVEQNALTSFKSRTTLVPCRANTIGPGLFLQADYAIGGADGTLGRGMQWQGMSLWMTLRYGKTPWITSSYIPTLAGRLFFLKELAGPLVAECN